MTSINISSINSKVEAWASSERGKKRIKNTVDKYIKTDVRMSQAGSRIVTLAMMKECGNRMAQYIRSEANGLPSSVSAAVASISCGDPVLMPDGSIYMELSFSEDLSRPSLEPEKYSGVQNIIALFNNGYESEAASHVFGRWHGEYVHGRGFRPALAFIQRAVNDFNSTYGHLGVTAESSSVYS